MKGSEARRRLSLLIAAYGVDGSLVVPAAGYGPGAEGADLAPGGALRWPPCECGHALCPDAPDAPGSSGSGR
ncbi:hypothetical protein ACIBJC_23495 [Streptomyces sp. NPDC050509]|uniref:hypothetical protein n=1 Tax=Streptomyces sp. NPDC050509 TaxID=3365620 RepID=UPI0037BBA4CB